MVRLHLQSNHNAKKHMITHQAAQTSKFVVRLDPHKHWLQRLHLLSNHTSP